MKLTKIFSWFKQMVKSQEQMWQKAIIRRNQELEKRSRMRKHNRWIIDVHKVKISVPSDPDVWGTSCQCLWVYKEMKHFREETCSQLFYFFISVLVSYRCFGSCQRRDLQVKFHHDIIIFKDLYHEKSEILNNQDTCINLRYFVVDIPNNILQKYDIPNNILQKI